MKNITINELIDQMMIELLTMQKALNTPVKHLDIDSLKVIIKSSDKKLQTSNLRLQSEFIKFGLK